MPKKSRAARKTKSDDFFNIDRESQWCRDEDAKGRKSRAAKIYNLNQFKKHKK